jgi:uncharacterized membrane protein YcaP (DUF421 family)
MHPSDRPDVPPAQGGPESMADVFGANADLVQIAMRSAIVYVATFLIFRLLGKGEIAQLNPADFVLLLLMANAVQNAMVGGDSSIAGGLVAALTLVVVSVLIKSAERRDRRLDWLLEGDPIELVREGVVVEEGLRRARLNRADLDRALRRNGAIDPNEVRLAMFETDGSISVVPGR